MGGGCSGSEETRQRRQELMNVNSGFISTDFFFYLIVTETLLRHFGGSVSLLAVQNVADVAHTGPGEHEVY